MKVFRVSIGNEEAIIAAGTQVEAAEALNMSLYSFRRFSSVAGNAEDIKAAERLPGIPLYRPADSGGRWSPRGVGIPEEAQSAETSTLEETAEVLRVRFARAGETFFDTPRYHSEGAAGIDLPADIEGPVLLSSGARHDFSTGVSVAIPPGYVGLVFARSGLGIRHGVSPRNGVGVIDSDYRGEIIVGLDNRGPNLVEIKPGDRIAQLVIVPAPRFRIEIVDSLDETERGAGGLGSTGKN